MTLPGLGTLCLDEEGRLRNRRLNPVASLLYDSVGGIGPIVGAALLVPADGSEPSEVVRGVEASYALWNARKLSLN